MLCMVLAYTVSLSVVVGPGDSSGTIVSVCVSRVRSNMWMCFLFVRRLEKEYPDMEETTTACPNCGLPVPKHIPRNTAGKGEQEGAYVWSYCNAMVGVDI